MRKKKKKRREKGESKKGRRERSKERRKEKGRRVKTFYIFVDKTLPRIQYDLSLWHDTDEIHVINLCPRHCLDLALPGTKRKERLNT